jgi:hypothetical protein
MKPWLVIWILVWLIDLDFLAGCVVFLVVMEDCLTI